MNMQNFLKRIGMLVALVMIVFIGVGCRGSRGWMETATSPQPFKEQPVDRIAVLGVYNQSFVQTKSSMNPFVVDALREHDTSLTVMPVGEVMAKLKELGLDGNLRSMINTMERDRRIPVGLGVIGMTLEVDAVIIFFITNVEQRPGGTGQESATGATVEAHILSAGIMRIIWQARASGVDYGFGYLPPPAPDKAVQMAVKAMFKKMPMFIHRSGKP